MKLLIQFLAVAAFVFVADFVWLGIVMKAFYHQELSEIIRQGPNGFAPRLLPALLVYILIPCGIILFVGPRIQATSSLLIAAGWGALWGLVVYGIYDLTNLAILEHWSTRVTVADILWGIALCGGSAVVLKQMNSINPLGT
ncbi:DUF2177 family protein [bacterium]|nr:DUF2177 family protein [bacterium]